jgi:glycosyltransferase involved in cell wall biosynthesis
MATPRLSIVIPTHKRADILKKCLLRIEKQTIAKQLEVIVVSDGHDDATEKLCRNSQFSFLNFQFFAIAKAQQGVARNKGVQEASAPLVMFIGDDCFLAPDACERHVAAHNAHTQQIAVLGFTTWDTSLDITPAMKWLEQTGWQFGYNMLIPYRHAFVPKDLQHRFTYTIHISVPSTIARAHPFREDVTLYGWEDILWGQELRDSGISLYYEPDATALHHHHVTLDDSLARIETLGKSLMHITKVAPELDRKPEGLKLLVYKLIALTPTMRGRHYRAFLRGLDSR